MIYWILTTEFPPSHGGGISTYCTYTAEMLQQRGHEVTIFVPDHSITDISEQYIDNIRVVHFLPQRTEARHFLGYDALLSYEFAEVVRKQMQKYGVPDILETQEYRGIGYYTQQFKLMGYPLFKELNILVTCHAPAFLYLQYNHDPVYKLPEYWIGLMEKSSILSAEIVISPSQYLVTQLKKEMSWQGVKESIVVNPMDTSKTPAPAASLQRNHIVCFGKLSPLKGTFKLLEYFDRLWENGFERPLHIIGGTQQVFHPEGRTMEDIVRRKYQSYIDSGLLKLRGQMLPEQSKQELLSAHVVIVPSLVDNLPYTVLEAMSLGKVVLASLQGGQSEIIEDGVDGFLFDHSVPNNFQEKLLHVLSLSDSEVLGVGKKATSTIQIRYSPEKVYSQKMGIIEEYMLQAPAKARFPYTACNDSLAERTATGALLSVVIPYYNMSGCVEETVRSILASEYPHKEIILVDDGSNEEGTDEVLAYLEESYPISVLRKENEGLPLTRNYGAAAAHGDYITFIDADDTVHASYFTKAISVLETYENVHFVGCWVKYFEGSSGHWPAFNPEPPFLLVHNMVNSGPVFKRRSYLQGGLNDPEMVYGMEDWDSIIGMIEKGYPGVVLPELLYNYRIRKESMARAFTKVKKLHLHKIIAEKHAPLYQKYGVEVANLLNSNGSGLYFDNPTREVAQSTYFQFPSNLKLTVKNKVKGNKFLTKMAIAIYRRINK